MDLSQGGLDTSVQLTEDGRVRINIHERNRQFSSTLKSAIQAKCPSEPQSSSIPAAPGDEACKPWPRLNIVIQVVGSRGDVQPFISLGQVLKNVYGHRVRLATHLSFKEFVEDNELEFFNIGGDPAELMAFMVKNPGLIPGMDALRNGDVSRRRKDMATVITGCWRACFEAGDGTGLPIISGANPEDVSFTGTARPFVADAIIANPPSFAHIHCAEKLGIPLHLMFTMPWSPTQAFPHPLANIQSTITDPSVTNYISYILIEMLTWQGLGDIINGFREKSLGLEPISIMWASSVIQQMRIPFTYCWSPSLIPRPNDWGNHLSLSGFYFLPLASNYTPPDDVTAFLAAGAPPVYIGFGSIVVDNPDELTRTVFNAVMQTGQRALVSKGWGGLLGGRESETPPNIFMIDNCPHDWLFKHVSCVVHHGGAGTTAAGLARGRPTVIIPFFGDQSFWGSMVAKAGVGPKPIPYKELTASGLAAAIREALKPAVLVKATELGAKIGNENGTAVGANFFHQQLKIDDLRCTLDPQRVAAFRIRGTDVKLSAFAFTVLEDEGLLSLEDIILYRSRNYDTEPQPRDPITGGGVAILGSIGDVILNVVDIKNDHRKPSSQVDAKSPTSPILEPMTGTNREISEAPEVSSMIATLSNGLESFVEEELPGREYDRLGFNTDSQERCLSIEGNPTQSLKRNRYTHPLEIGNIETPQPQVDASSAIPETSKVEFDTIIKAGKTATKIIDMSWRVPMEFTIGVAKGLHNAPLLYGDDSVREMQPVTGIKSGLKAAGQGFGYGIYDGISGLVTQPLAGAKKGGVVGAIKGFGKGIGGVVIKSAAGGWALPAYVMNGIYKEIRRLFRDSVESYILASRCAQGVEEYARCTPQERSEVVRRWNTVKAELQEQKARKATSCGNGMHSSDVDECDSAD